MNKIFILCLLLPAFSYTQVATPKCTSVSVFTPAALTPSDVAYYSSYVASTYPSATKLADATSSYNCHNYAWNQSDGGPAYWMNTPGDDSYWTDGSYVEVTDHAAPYATKVSYASDDHSAITTSNPNVHISKWGAGPLMQHAPGYTPYDETTLKYYSVPISGDRFICNGSGVYSTFTASGISSYTWSGGSTITPATQTSSSNSYTASTIYSGVGSVAVSMYSTCSGTTVTGTKTVNLGNGPMMGGFQFNGSSVFPDPACVNSGGTFTVLPHPWFPSGYTVSLVWSSINCYIPGSSGTTMNALFNGAAGSTATVRVDAYGPCGLGENNTVLIPLIDCGLPGQDWRVYPNPVRGGTNTVNVQLPFQPGKNAVLQIFDKGMMLRREVRVQSSSFTISLSGVPAGTVYLSLIDGSKRFKKIVIKE